MRSEMRCLRECYCCGSCVTFSHGFCPKCNSYHSERERSARPVVWQRLSPRYWWNSFTWKRRWVDVPSQADREVDMLEDLWRKEPSR